MTEYDITQAFKRIENELMDSMIRNMDNHQIQEAREGLNWIMWQAEQLKALEIYKRVNKAKYGKEFSSLNAKMGEVIRKARESGNSNQERVILEATKKGFSVAGKPDGSLTSSFFRLNDRKLDALISATTNDVKKAETAVLRMANDQYRKVIFNAQVYANSGAGTYKQAVDMATKDFIMSGLNCVEYKNGARHTISDYADMAIRTASKRAYLQGEGEKRREWGISTVIITKRGNPCPLCLPFCGKVLIDDVWSGGTRESGKYPLMSLAIKKGLYHPRCKDSHSTYFPGISTMEDGWTEEELKAVENHNKSDAKSQYVSRQIERYRRLGNLSLDPENKKKYYRKVKEWEDKNTSLLTLEEEGAIVRYVGPDAYSLNDKLRRGESLTDFEKEWIISLNKALDKLPNYEGNLNRGVIFVENSVARDFYESFVVGEVYKPEQYLSTTKQGVYDSNAQVQIYIQNTKKGKDLKGVNDMEKEVLYSAGSGFIIVNKTEKAGNYFILLEEV